MENEAMKKTETKQQETGYSYGTKEVQTVKIVVLGSGGVGKSALTQKYITSIFYEKFDPTIEDSYRKNVEFEGDPYILDLLDTGAGRGKIQYHFTISEEYSSIRDTYMRVSDAFMLCFSITDPSSFQDAQMIHEQLLRSVDDETDSVPIVLVGTKSDLEEERRVSFDEGKMMSMNFGNCSYIETSAKENINVMETFEILLRGYKASKGMDVEDDEYKDGQKYENTIYDPKKEKRKKFCRIM